MKIFHDLGWEFIKEKSKQETNHAFDQEKKTSVKKIRSRPRKHALVQESDDEKKELAKENTHSSRKAPTKKRTRSRKHALGQESVTEKLTPSRKNDNGQESNALGKEDKKRFKLF